MAPAIGKVCTLQGWRYVLKLGDARYLRVRPGGGCKILGVLMTLCGPSGANLEILGVLNASFPPIFRNIGVL